MAVNPDEDTEFNDALRKHGIIPPRPEAPRTPSPPPAPTLEETLTEYDSDELRELTEDAKDDETERVIETYRRQRLAEMRKEQKRARFGTVIPISRDDYTREVNDASKVDEDDENMKGKGTGVVCFLYKDGLPPSDRAFQHIRTLSSRYPHTKFVSIIGDRCIPNYPDRNLPSFFVYRNGTMVNQQVAWGADKERVLEELEAILLLAGAITPSRLPPAERRRKKEDDDLEDDFSDDDPSSHMRSSIASTNAHAPKNVRNSAQDDDDSDFDL